MVTARWEREPRCRDKAATETGLVRREGGREGMGHSSRLYVRTEFIVGIGFR